MKLTAVDPLVMELSGTTIVISSPRLRTRLRVTPRVAELLIAARSGLDASEDNATVAKLVQAGFLVAADVGEATVPAPWQEWGTTAWSFHARIRDTPFVVNDAERLKAYRARLATRARPSSVRPSRSDQILLLPRVRTGRADSYFSVLERRRTHRDFVDHDLALDSFSDLLHYTFAPLRFADAGEMGVLQLRGAASGGARHETEAFVFVFTVSGVEPGLYHYDNIRHGLVPLSAAGGRDQLEHLTHNQGFFRRACFGVLMVAVADRMSWKYPNPVAYRILLNNVGHVAQVFSMTAAALGVGAAMTGAIRGTEADAMLGLDQPREFTTFALGCGLPVLGPDNLPKAVRTPRTPWLD
jgi:SagB-type dehydrogenase family enzyme